MTRWSLHRVDPRLPARPVHHAQGLKRLVCGLMFKLDEPDPYRAFATTQKASLSDRSQVTLRCPDGVVHALGRGGSVSRSAGSGELGGRRSLWALGSVLVLADVPGLDAHKGSEEAGDLPSVEEASRGAR